jgi:hypothetical protein
MGPASPLPSIGRCSAVSRSFLRRKLPDGSPPRGLHLDTACAPAVTWQLTGSGTKSKISPIRVSTLSGEPRPDQSQPGA